jgi:hypothetical protein
MFLSFDDHAKDHLTVTRPSRWAAALAAAGSSDR